MSVWHGNPLRQNAVTYEQLLEQWIAAAKKQTAETRDVEALRERLRLALAAEWPERVMGEREGQRILLTRPGKGDRVSGMRIGSGVPSIVVVGPEGAEAARKNPVAEELIRAGKPVLILTVFQA